MEHVAVRPAVLGWAWNRLSASRRQQLQSRFPKILDWLQGKSQPTWPQLESFARAAYVPFGYLLLEEPPAEELPIPLFRTFEHSKSPPSVELLDVVRLVQARQQWMREYLQEQGEKPLAFIGSARYNREDERLIARRIRETLGLQEDWSADCPSWQAAFRQLLQRCEKIGVTVVVSALVGNNTHRPLRPEEFRGFVLIDEYAPVIFINAADARAAQMFTLAHELAHLWYGQSAAFDLAELEPARHVCEQACNRVAAEFLVPAEQLRRCWDSVQHHDVRLRLLARRFKVSELVLARRALDLKLIDRPAFVRFYRGYLQTWAEKRRRHVAPAAYYTTVVQRLGRRFLHLLCQALDEGRILYHEAYRLTGLYGASFERVRNLLREV
jgi:Zn-dependent peptidase ImmA (M78 family)